MVCSDIIQVDLGLYLSCVLGCGGDLHFVAEHLRADNAVGDVRLRAVAKDRRGVALPDADVMKQRAVNDNAPVNRLGNIIRRGLQNLKRLVANLLAMLDEQSPKRRILWIKMLDDGKR